MNQRKKDNLKTSRDSKLCSGALMEPNPTFVTECDLHLSDLTKNASPQPNVNTKEHPYIYVISRQADRAPSAAIVATPKLGTSTRLRNAYDSAETIQISLPRLRCLEAA